MTIGKKEKKKEEKCTDNYANCALELQEQGDGRVSVQKCGSSEMKQHNLCGLVLVSALAMNLLGSLLEVIGIGV